MAGKPNPAPPEVIGQLALKLSSLPEADLQLVVELVGLLEEQRLPEPTKPPAEIRERARRRAHLLREVPREQLVARFAEIGEQVRQEAIARGTAIDGDWAGD